eukprot:3461067-Karenia_brevis.AAC.1
MPFKSIQAPQYGHRSDSMRTSTPSNNPNTKKSWLLEKCLSSIREGMECIQRFAPGALKAIIRALSSGLTRSCNSCARFEQIARANAC